jgi:hypothetical protein
MVFKPLTPQPLGSFGAAQRQHILAQRAPASAAFGFLKGEKAGATASMRADIVRDACTPESHYRRKATAIPSYQSSVLSHQLICAPGHRALQFEAGRQRAKTDDRELITENSFDNAESGLLKFGASVHLAR